MALGMEMMMQSIIKSLGLDKDFIQQNVKGAFDMAQSLQAQFNRIEAKQDLILKHLGVEIGSEQYDDIRQIALSDFQGNGSDEKAEDRSDER